MTGEEFKDKRRWLKTYRVNWDMVIFNDGNIKTVEKQADLVANSFLDALAKTALLHKCFTQDIRSITFIGMVQEFEEDA